MYSIEVDKLGGIGGNGESDMKVALQKSSGDKWAH